MSGFIRGYSDINGNLHCHLHVDLRVGIVVLHEKVIESKVLDPIHLSLELECWEWPRSPLKLFLQRFHVVRIDVRIPERVDKVARLQVRHMCDHVGQKRVTGNVEGHSESHVRRSLVHLAGQLSVAHVELHEAVARREGHNGNVHGIPGAHYDPTVVGVRLNEEEGKQTFFGCIPTISP